MSTLTGASVSSSLTHLCAHMHRHTHMASKSSWVSTMAIIEDWHGWGQDSVSQPQSQLWIDKWVSLLLKYPLAPHEAIEEFPLNPLVFLSFPIWLPQLLLPSVTPPPSLKIILPLPQDSLPSYSQILVPPSSVHPRQQGAQQGTKCFHIQDPPESSGGYTGKLIPPLQMSCGAFLTIAKQWKELRWSITITQTFKNQLH